MSHVPIVSEPQTGPSDEVLEDAFIDAFNDAYYLDPNRKDDDPDSLLFHPSHELLSGIQAGVRAVRSALQLVPVMDLLSPECVEAGAKALAFVDIEHLYPDPDTAWEKAADEGGKEMFRREYRAAVAAAISEVDQ
jgi:hypothetical protein